MKKFVKPTAVGLTLMLGVGLAACGDDDDTEDAAASDYCKLATEIGEQEDFPSVEQLAAIRDAAPDEISEQIDFVATEFIEAIEAGNPSAAFTPEFEEAFGPIEEYDSEVCGIAGDEEDDEEQEASATELDPGATRVDVSAVEYDFEFDAPDAGRVSFVMRNDGEEAHFMLLAKLKDGATLEEALGADDPEEFTDPDFPDLESDLAQPGEEAVLTADLEPGDYAMLCFIPGPDGQPHAMSGMAVPFTVG